MHAYITKLGTWSKEESVSNVNSENTNSAVSLDWSCCIGNGHQLNYKLVTINNHQV